MERAGEKDREFVGRGGGREDRKTGGRFLWGENPRESERDHLIECYGMSRRRSWEKIKRKQRREGGKDRERINPA